MPSAWPAQESNGSVGMSARGATRSEVDTPGRNLLAVLALVAAAGTGTELAATRLYSAALNYHLTFLAISAAMLGTATGGVLVAAHGRPAAMRIERLTTVAAAGIALIAAAFAWTPFGHLGARTLLLAIMAGNGLLWLPFACHGALLAIAFGASGQEQGRLYAADLAGAAGGVLLALAVMQAAGPPWALAVASGLAAAAVWAARVRGPAGSRLARTRQVAGAVLRAAGVDTGDGSIHPTPVRHAAGSAPARLPYWLLALAAVAVAAAAALGAGQPNVLPNKPLFTFLESGRYRGAHEVMWRWDALSRVDVFEAPGAPLAWQPAADAAGSVAGAPVHEPPLLGATIDGDALTTIVVGGPEAAASLVERLPISLPYVVAPRRRVLVIGPGGGLDVVTALHYGARQVDAVEVNPALIQLMRGPLAALAGHLYARPGVHLVLDEGRSFVRRTSDRYDAIILTAVDSWAALATGAYSLAESYLYTSEALRDFVDHLAPGGVVAISRWYTEPPRELQRLALMGQQRLASRGGAEALLLLKAGDFGTLLLHDRAFSPAERERAVRFAAAHDFRIIPVDSARAAPAAAAESRSAEPAAAAGEASRAGALPPAAALAGRPLPAPSQGGGTPARLPAPATDDRPYFFDFVRWSDVLAGRAPLPAGHAVLLISLIQALALACIAVELPWRRLRQASAAFRPWRAAAFFATSGAGFMIAEMVLLGRLMLLLGHPAFAVAFGLPALLLGAALGSTLAHAAAPATMTEAQRHWGRQWAGVLLDLASPMPALASPPGRERRWLAALVGLGAAVLALQAAGWPSWLSATLGWPLPARIALALALLGTAAVPMGSAVPAGLQWLVPPGEPAAAWAWGINGAAAAVGASIAVMLAMELGLTATLLVAAGCYLAAGALLGYAATSAAHFGEMR